MNVRGWLSPLAGVVLGAAYGLAARWMIHDPPPRPSDAVAYTFAGVSIAFLFLVPFALGALSAALAPPGLRNPWPYWLFMPWVSVGLLVLAVLALAWEGAICLVMAAPIVLIMGMLGGLAVGVAVILRRRRAPPPAAVVSCLLLPFAFGPVEARLPLTDDMRTVTTVVDVRADAASVWRQVVRVPAIADHEQTTGVFQHMGIPRPLEAALDGEGVGAMRQARFQGGIRFHEQIKEWEPERLLGFSVEVDAASVAAHVLDPHVRVGGPYFDVLYGRFLLEPRGDVTRLTLESRHRVTTRFNGYARLWSEAVMRDVQENVCRVIRNRAEASAGGGAH